MDTLETLPQMHNEHQAWLAVVRELDREDLNINVTTQIHAALTLWGEELAVLRKMQDDEIVHNAHEEARARYNREIGFLPY